MCLPDKWTLDLPDRAEKPRGRGLTEISDKGLGLNLLRDTIEIAGEYIDLAKFSIGSAVITGLLEEKIAEYHSHDIRVFFGGTTFEKFFQQGKVDTYTEIHRTLGVSGIEGSDGTIEIAHRVKCQTIEQLAKEFTVLAEVGSKDDSYSYSSADWVDQIRDCLNAGAWKVIVEGRESGRAGIYRDDGCPRQELDHIVSAVSVDDLIIEAPRTENQIDMINRYGPNVNLGNIPPLEVLVLESQRLGLRYDTF